MKKLRSMLNGGPNYVLGIDLGTSKIVAVIAELTQGNHVGIVDVKDVPSQGMHRGNIVNLEQVVTCVKQVSSQILHENNLIAEDMKAVVATFNAETSTNIITKGVVPITHGSTDSTVTEEDVENAVKRALDNLKLNHTLRSNTLLTVAHNIPIAYTLDGDRDVTHPVGMLATQLEVTLLSIAVPKSSLRDVAKCFERAGLPLHALLFKPLATSLGVPRHEANVADNLILDIGAGTTDIAIFANKRPCYFASVPLGGNDISHDIFVVEHLPQYKAEEIKQSIPLTNDIKQGDSLSFDFGGRSYDLDKQELQAIIGARIDSIISEKVKPVLANSGASFERVLLTGGVARTKGIENLVAEVLDMPCRRILPTFGDQLVSEKYNEGYVTAMGVLRYIKARANSKIAYVDNLVGLGLLPWRLNGDDVAEAQGQGEDFENGGNFFESFRSLWKSMF